MLIAPANKPHDVGKALDYERMLAFISRSEVLLLTIS
jgi:hypothetical protein